MANNHVIDPTFFFPAIDIFSFPYDIYIRTGITIDALGNRHDTLAKKTIYGSIQSQGKRREQSTSGNTWVNEYKFYCKSLYRIDVNDYIHYKKKWLIVNDVQDYDEYGCRECTLNEIDIRAHKDLLEYEKYQTGVEII